MIRPCWVMVALGTTLLSLGIARAEEPDLQREARFHEIYKRYNEIPTPEDQWKKVLGDREAQTYKIQEGDTLWDLSETLFGDPLYWPKIWSLNTGEIENPHEIIPKQTVKFFPGTLGEAPALAVSNKEGEAEISTPVELDLSNFVLPEPAKQYMPVVEPPKSLPNWSYSAEQTKRKVDFEIDHLDRNMGPRETDVGYYAVEDDLASVGKVVDIENGMESASLFQTVIVKLTGDGVGPGQKYLAVKEVDSVSNDLVPKSARVIEVQGQLLIKEPVDSSKSLYRAVIEKSITHMEKGAVLIQGDWPRVSLEGGEKGPDIQGDIFGGQFNKERILFGRDAIVYLNIGAASGVVEGQLFTILANPKVRVDAPKTVENLNRIGKVKVVKVTQTFATAVILDSSDEVRIGDKVSSQ